MTISVEGKIGIGFGAALLLLAVGAVVSYRTTISLLDAMIWVNRTHEILIKVESLLSHVKDIETGMRGYVITGRDLFLEPYETALTEVEQDFTALRLLTADDPDHRRNLDTLASLLTERISHARRTVDLRWQEGFPAAAENVQKGRGQEVMGAIRKVVQQIQEEGRELLRRREEATSANAQRAIVILLLGSTFAVVLVAFASMLIFRELAARQRAEEELRASEKRFRSLIENSSDAVALFGEDGTILYGSPSTIQVLGTRHGGRVWAEAAIDAGATFFFTLSGGNPDDGTSSRGVVG